MAEQLTVEELLALPAVTDLATAGKAWGLGITKSSELARADEFPCKVLRLGRAYKVRKVDLMRSLGLNLDGSPIRDPSAGTQQSPASPNAA